MGAPREISFDDEGVPLKGWLVAPDGPGPHPALLVMHDARGLGPGVIERAEHYARAGYVAFAAGMYENGGYFPDPREAGPYMGPLYRAPAAIRRRMEAALAVLAALPGVDTARLGAVGFCFGGQCALELARGGAGIRAAVSFHGLLMTSAPAKPDTVRAKLLVITGALDPFAPISDVERFRQEMVAARADHHITIYGQGWHAFTDPEASTMDHVGGIRHDPLLERLSLAQAAEFLDAVVRPGPAA